MVVVRNIPANDLPVGGGGSANEKGPHASSKEDDEEKQNCTFAIFFSSVIFLKGGRNATFFSNFPQ